MALENLSEEEAYLWAIMSDTSGLDLAEFCWYAASEEESDGCFRARPYQWPWWRCVDSLQIDQCSRSVGKSLSIKLRGFAFPFLWPGQEMMVTAPELNHLEPIVNLIEEQFYATRLGREMLVKGRGGTTHRPFLMKFANQSRIMGAIPQRDGRGVKGKHPLWLEHDEAQDYPHPGWVELQQTLKRGKKGAVWRAHGVTRGVEDDFKKFSTDPNSKWTVHRITAMHRPDWTDEEREEAIAFYGSRDDPDYRRNILGDHGDAQNPLFVLHRLMKCVDDSPESQYNESEYVRCKITDEILNDFDGNIEFILDQDIPSPNPRYKSFWGGMDIGFTNDPSEILIFAEYALSAEEIKARKQTEKNYPVDGLTCLKLVARVSLIRIRASDQVRAILWLFRKFEGIRAFSMDATGNGLPVFEDAQDAAPQYLNRIKGYKFGSKILVGFDDRVEVDELIGDVVEEAGIEAIMEIYATDQLRKLVDHGRLWLPFDPDLLRSFQGQTQSVKSDMNAYGKRTYSKGNFHVLDAARLAVVGWKQYSIEKQVAALGPEAVIDLPMWDDGGW